jgi:hypothetical protein
LTIPGIPEQLTPANFATVVLHDLYAQCPVGTQILRKTELNDIATALLQRIRSDRQDQLEFLRALASQIPGRHMLLWSATPSVERAILHLGASAGLTRSFPSGLFISLSRVQ